MKNLLVIFDRRRKTEVRRRKLPTNVPYDRWKLRTSVFGLRTSMLLLPILFFLSSCEEEFTLDVGTPEIEIVVEGHIEAAEEPAVPLPPYVILTRTIPFRSSITAEEISNLFVHDAFVTVSDGETTVELTEACWEDIPDELKSVVVELLPEELDTIPVNVCIYLDPNFALFGEIGKTYDLVVEADGKRLTSSTTIPPHTLIDSLEFIPAPGDFGEEYFELRGFMTDPEEYADFYRYFTSTNGSFLSAAFSSVVDDKFFNGQSFEFPLARTDAKFGTSFDSQNPPDPDDFRVNGLFREGDEVIVKWINIDEDHFRFWETLEFNIINQGPFGSYTRISSNIEGGVGIWGGQSASYYSITVE